MKNMLLKVLSFIVTAAVTFGSALAAELPERVQGLECSAQLQLLSDLNLLPDGFFDSFDPEREMKRGDFAALIVSLMGLDKYESIVADKDIPFADVLSNDKNLTAIKLAHEFGLFSGDGSGNFTPGGKISYSQAVKVVVSALGYDEIAAYYGGYPTGYLTLASKNGLLKGISSGNSDKISSSALIMMMSNMLNTKVLQYLSISDDSIKLSTESDETFITLYHKLDAYTGQVKGVPGAVASDVDPLTDNEVLIGEKLYKTNGNHYTGYFGCMVDFYTDSNGKVAAMSHSSCGNTVTKINIKDIDSLTASHISYYEGYELKTVNFAQTTDFLYNGRLYSGYISGEELGGDGEVQLIDSEADRSIDIVSVTCAENYVVKSANETRKEIYDLYSGKTFSADGLDNCIFVDLFGETMNYGELSEYDVISVVQSKDKKQTSMYFSNIEAEGTIDEIDGTDRITVSGVNYTVAENFKSQVSKLKLGESALFPRDIYGNIAACKPYASSYKMGYITGAMSSGGLDNKLKLRIFDEDGVMNELTAADKILLDGTRKNSSDCYSALSQMQPVRFYTSNGLLTSVDTVNTGAGNVDDKLELMYQGYTNDKSQGTTIRWNGYQKIFASKIAASGSTKVISIPYENLSKTEDYAVKNYSYFTHDGYYCIDAYTAGDDKHVADLIMMYESGDSATYGALVPFAVVDNVSAVLDEDGESTYRIYAYRNGAPESRLVDDPSIVDGLMSINPEAEGKVHSLKCGDIIKYLVNDRGDIIGIKLFYDREADVLASNVNVGEQISLAERTLKANVYSKKNAIMWLTQDKLAKSGIELTLSEIESINAATFTVFCYSETNGKSELRVGSTSDLVDYKSSETGFSSIILCQRYNDPGILLVR